MSIESRLLDAECEDTSYFINPDYEDAVIGVIDDGRLVYDFDKMVGYLMNNEGWSDIESIEWIEYNVIRSIPYMGEKKPIIVYSLD
jgi:hypothetical protein